MFCVGSNFRIKQLRSARLAVRACVMSLAFAAMAPGAMAQQTESPQPSPPATPQTPAPATATPQAPAPATAAPQAAAQSDIPQRRPRFYLTFGGGVIFPNAITSTRSNLLPNEVLNYFPAPVQLPPPAPPTLPQAPINFDVPFSTQRIVFNQYPGFDANVAVGYRFSPQLRTDIEFTYLNSTFDRADIFARIPFVTGTNFPDLPVERGGDLFRDLRGFNAPLNGLIQNSAVLANVYVDFPVSRLITPYLGFGAGFSHVTVSEIGIPGVGTISRPVARDVFAYQFRAGLGFYMSPDVDLILGYRFFGTSSFDIPDLRRTQTQSIHNVELGLRLGL